MSYSAMGKQRCQLCHAPTLRSCDMCQSCGKSWDRYRLADDGTIYSTMLWAAERAWRERRKHTRQRRRKAGERAS